MLIKDFTKVIRYRSILLTGFFLIAFSSWAQNDVSQLDLGGDVTAWFDQTISKENMPIVSGSYEEVISNSTIGHKFFESDKWSKMTVRYYGQEYEQLHGLYDITGDILLLQHPTYLNYYSQPIKVQQDKIESFQVNGHTFRYYYKQQAPNSGKGFYDQLLMGDHVELIARRKKEATVGTNETQVDYKVIDAYYLKYQGSYHKITSRRSVIKTLIAYKKPLRRYIRQHLLIIKAGNDEDMIELLEYCDDLITGQ